MLSRLRILLVAAVALSTVLVGMRDTLAAGRAAAVRVCSVAGESFGSSREDDSGIKSEQVEEDDGDEEEGRDLHFLGADARDCRPDPCAGALPQWPRCRAAHLRCRDTLGRGPPAIG
jgi:hypothetical protein